MTLHDLMIDKRIVQRNIEQGKLEPAEYQRILNALPDLSDKVWRRPAATDAVAASAPAAVSAPESGVAPASVVHADSAALHDAAPALHVQPTALPG